MGLPGTCTGVLLLGSSLPSCPDCLPAPSWGLRQDGQAAEPLPEPRADCLALPQLPTCPGKPPASAEPRGLSLCPTELCWGIP